MKKNKIYIIFASIILIFAGFFYFFLNLKLVSIDKKIFVPEIVSTYKDRNVGLGKRSSLCRRCAMLFIFEKKGNYPFWMKDMYFDLDIIWLSDGKIVYLEKNVSYKNVNILNPKVNADKVLEINAGIADEFDFKVGDSVAFWNF